MTRRYGVTVTFLNGAEGYSCITAPSLEAVKKYTDAQGYGDVKIEIATEEDRAWAKEYGEVLRVDADGKRLPTKAELRAMEEEMR